MPDRINDLTPTVYLACPYSHPDARIRARRAAAASRAAAQVMATGLDVLSPVSMGHAIGEAAPDLPRDWERWARVCLLMLTCCDALYVLMLEGVRESVGVAAEIRAARELGLPCHQLVPVGDSFELVRQPQWWL